MRPGRWTLWCGWLAAFGFLTVACSTNEAGLVATSSVEPTPRPPTSDDTRPEIGAMPPTLPTTLPPAGVTATDPTDTTRVLPQGFDRVQATVTTAAGEVCELCLWLAETSAQRSLGLMNVTDLGADGMAFRYERPYTGRFWMKNTLLPLSIAFFAPDGHHIDEFDMEPCTTASCPRYRTPAGFLVAVETVQGGLPGIGIGPGSTLALTDLPCA